VILDQIVAAKRAAHAERPALAEDHLWARLAGCSPARGLAAALRDPARPGLRAIAEFKRRSPSAGPIRPNADPALIAQAYAAAGAAALSVLTDRAFFDGAGEHLVAARAACRLPALRKDFLLDRRDLLESRLLGADAALLIVRLLAPALLADLIAVARRAGLEVLVEAHSEAEVGAALTAGATIVGINHRDLDTLAIDLGLSARVRAQVGPDVVLVAESGLRTAEDVALMRAHGADAILVGESLMRAESPGAALRELLA